jgi:hypothetical protein
MLNFLTNPDPAVKQETFSLGGKQMIVEHNRNNIAYMFNPLECFTWWRTAYILSVDIIMESLN